MRCPTCRNGQRRPARRPWAEQRGDHIAVVTDVPVEECDTCGDYVIDEAVALRLDAMLTEMLAADTVAIRPYNQPANAA